MAHGDHAFIGKVIITPCGKLEGHIITEVRLFYQKPNEMQFSQILLFEEN